MKKQSACPPERRGSGLIFAVVLLFVILGMVVTLSSVTVLETKMNQKTKSSVGAFYNSESGVEWALNKIANSSNDAAISTLGSCPFTGCSVLFLGADGKVLATSATIDQVKAVRSTGTQGGDTQRAIEAAVASGGGYSYTYWCYDNSGHGTPVCPDSVTIGTQGPCDSGFTVKRDLGQFGYCVVVNHLGDYFSAPGTTCSGPTGKVGEAYVCSQ